jgi:hypothetical protein
VSGIMPRPARAMALLAMLSLSGFGASGPISTAYADDCLVAPNSAAPKSSHWYYRIDRVKKLRCWYLHALDEAGHQSVAGARPGIASSVRLQSTDARSASQPGPSVGAPISLTLADSPRPVNKPTVKSHPVTSTVRNPDAESSGREDFAQSIPQAQALQDSLQAEGSNPLTKSAALNATPAANFEGNGREGSPAASISQTPTLQRDAPEAEGSNPTPMSAPPYATPNADVEGSGPEGAAASPTNPAHVIGPSADGAEEINEAYLMFKSGDQASDAAESTIEATNTHPLIVLGHKWNINSMGLPAAMPTAGETIAILLFGMAVAGMLSGILLMIVQTRRERSADHPEPSLIDDRHQLDARETDLEAVLLANMMALRPPRLKRSNVAKPFLP